MLAMLQIQRLLCSTAMTPLLLSTLPTLTSSQSYGLPVFLQFCDQAISLLHNVCVLLVLIVRPVGLDDSIDTVNCTGNAVGRNKFGKVAKRNIPRQ